MASKPRPFHQSTEALLNKLRQQPLDERRARLLAALLKVVLKTPTSKNGGRSPRTLH